MKRSQYEALISRGRLQNSQHQGVVLLIIALSNLPGDLVASHHTNFSSCMIQCFSQQGHSKNPCGLFVK